MQLVINYEFVGSNREGRKKPHKKMISEYEKILLLLPKGVLVSKAIKNNLYYYQQYREGKKIISVYIGRDSDRLAETNSLIERRKQVAAMLKALREEYALAQKFTRE
jgi:hypothetical protein